MSEEKQEEILGMLKALADESRLTLLRCLSLEERTVGDLAQQIDLGEPTVSHHLARLRETGLVTLRMAGNQRFYRVNPQGLAMFKQLITTIEQFAPQTEPVVDDNRWITALGWDAEDQKVLKEHTHNGLLTRYPNKQKKLAVILRWLATLFQPGRLYSEPEVNVVLKGVYTGRFCQFATGTGRLRLFAPGARWGEVLVSYG